MLVRFRPLSPSGRTKSYKRQQQKKNLGPQGGFERTPRTPSPLPPTGLLINTSFMVSWPEIVIVIQNVSHTLFPKGAVSRLPIYALFLKGAVSWLSHIVNKLIASYAVPIRFWVLSWLRVRNEKIMIKVIIIFSFCFNKFVDKEVENSNEMLIKVGLHVMMCIYYFSFYGTLISYKL